MMETSIDLANSNERELTEQALRDGEARLAGIIASAMDAIISVDLDQRIVLFNRAAEQMFGCEASGALGQPVERFIPTRLQAAHSEHMRQVAETDATASGTGAPGTVSGVRANGEEFPIEATISQVEVAGTKLFTVFIRDITERTRAEAQIRASLHEKEILLREIHHRVKNNLQVIASLVNLQADQITDERTRGLLFDTQSRVQAIALIHEKLYQSASLAEINLGDYLRELVENLFRSYSPVAVEYEVLVAPVSVSIDTAMPCGLIASELISNCLKHAFPDGRAGRVRVALDATESGVFALVVQDDGVGLPSNFESRRAESLGLQLVDTLARQLGAFLRVESDGGTTFQLRFQEARYEARR
jgi:PAS domain S-box-containing protein